jgi:hypothetical protein
MSSGNEADNSDDSDEDNRGVTGFVFGIVSRTAPLPPCVSPLNTRMMRAGNVNKRGKLEPDAYDEETREDLDEAGNSAYSSHARAGLGLQQTDEAAPAAAGRSVKMARSADPGGAAGAQMPTGGSQSTAATAGLDARAKGMAARVLAKGSDTAGDSGEDDYDFDAANSGSDAEDLAGVSVSTSTVTKANQAEPSAPVLPPRPTKPGGQPCAGAPEQAEPGEDALAQPGEVQCEDCLQRPAHFGLAAERESRWCAGCEGYHTAAVDFRQPLVVPPRPGTTRAEEARDSIGVAEGGMGDAGGAPHAKRPRPAAPEDTMRSEPAERAECPEGPERAELSEPQRSGGGLLPSDAVFELLDSSDEEEAAAAAAGCTPAGGAEGGRELPVEPPEGKIHRVDPDFGST